MKTTLLRACPFRFLAFTVLAAAALATVTAGAAPRNQTRESGAVALGTRFHSLHSTFTALPYADGDFSYSAAYDYGNEMSYLELAVNYCPSPSRTNTLSDAITPQANLCFKDGIWLGGIGAAATYTKDETIDKGDWSDFYYQLMLGVGTPGNSGLGLNVQAVYPFEKWDDLGEFDAGDIEVQVWLKLAL